MILPIVSFVLLEQAIQTLEVIETPKIQEVEVVKVQYTSASETYSVTDRGEASWYGPGFHGRRTASGEVFNQNALTAAHRTLPFGTQVRVTNLSNNRQVVVRINDRGPFSGGRIIDLSREAANQIGMIQSGVANVTLEYNP